MSEAQRAGGARGGRDQFQWNDVKEDKHRCAWQRPTRLP